MLTRTWLEGTRSKLSAIIDRIDKKIYDSNLDSDERRDLETLFGDVEQAARFVDTMILERE